VGLSSKPGRGGKNVERHGRGRVVTLRIAEAASWRSVFKGKGKKNIMLRKGEGRKERVRVPFDLIGGHAIVLREEKGALWRRGGGGRRSWKATT